jgi:hypothetical protein
LALYTHEETDKSLLNNEGKTAIEIMDEKIKGATCLFKIAIRVLHEWDAKEQVKAATQSDRLEL